jgi:AcrR family transcriptional regulator
MVSLSAVVFSVASIAPPQNDHGHSVFDLTLVRDLDKVFRRPDADAVKKRRTRSELRLDKRERIRAAATTLFHTVGYAKTTTKAVAARAGVAAGTVFLYASDKEDLLFMVIRHQLAETVDEAFATLPKKGTLVDRLMHIFGALFAMYGRHPEMSRVFVRALPGAKGPNARDVDALTIAFFYRLASLVEAGKTEGELGSHVAPILAAQAIFAIYYFTLQGWLNGYASAGTALDPGLRDPLSLLVRGMRA